MRLCLWAAIWIIAPAACQAASPQLQSLYDAHQWFRLRDAVYAGGAPAFYRGAVSAAFNDAARALEELEAVIRAAPQSEDAYNAHELLTAVHWRSGRYDLVMTQLDALARLKPDAPDVKEARKLFGVLAQFPPQTVAAKGYSRLPCQLHEGNTFIPVTINGQPAQYMLDTGANLPVVSASEAEHRKLKVAKASGRLGPSMLYSFEVGDVAMADDLHIGRLHLKNVAFLVLADERFADLPREQRGVLGLPILLAMENLRWKADGTFEFALPAIAQKPAPPNVYFDNAMPIAQVQFESRTLDFALDTGAVRTDLYPRFAKEFAELLKKSGHPGISFHRGVGGAFDLDSIVLPEVCLRIGGRQTTLRPAQVLVKDVGSEWHHGNLGLDLLRQARVITLDFRRMILTLE